MSQCHYVTPPFPNTKYYHVFSPPSPPELVEEPGVEPVVEGVTFYVKYLGSSVVCRPSGEEPTATAIRHIVASVSGAAISPLRFYHQARTERGLLTN